jgi:DNA-binding CsgD family transcriptional regulator
LSAKLDDALQGRTRQIDADFDKWGLSAAEKEIALFLLKGLRFQDIADLRHTSERTVRQQAQAIYRKAGLDGRTDLSAHFVEDFMNPVADSAADKD